MSAQVRGRIVRSLTLGAFAVAMASLLAGGLLVLSDYATRAQASDSAAEMLGAECGGNCGDEAGGCATEVLMPAEEMSICPVAETDDDGAASEEDESADREADSPHHEVAHEAEACDEQDCTDCHVDCPHHKPAASEEPAKA